MARVPREVSSQARYELASLRSQGFVLTDDDVCLINALCWEIENPQARRELSAGFPVKVGGVVLWPRTVQAVHWFERAGCDMPDATFALAYSMAKGREPDMLLADWQDVLRWAERLTCTRDELIVAMSEVHAQDERDPIPVKESERENSVAELSTRMHAIHGGDIEQWERHCSFGYLCDLADVIAGQTIDGGIDKLLKDRANLALYVAVRAIKERKANA